MRYIRIATIFLAGHLMRVHHESTEHFSQRWFLALATMGILSALAALPAAAGATVSTPAPVYHPPAPVYHAPAATMRSAPTVVSRTPATPGKPGIPLTPGTKPAPLAKPVSSAVAARTVKKGQFNTVSTIYTPATRADCAAYNKTDAGSTDRAAAAKCVSAAKKGSGLN